MNEFWISLISGIAGGLIVLLAQNAIEKYKKEKDQKNEKIIKSTRFGKILAENTLESLEVGLSVDKMKEILGIPDFIFKEEYSGLIDKKPSNYFTYNFSNAIVRITSQNNLSIDTISILSRDDRTNLIKFFLNNYEASSGGILGRTKLNKEIIKNVINHYSNRTAREMYFGVETYYGRFGNYLNYTYFGSSFNHIEKYEKTNDPKDLLGSTIEGFCISNAEGFAPYISDYE